jgi:hypothetical protein
MFCPKPTKPHFPSTKILPFAITKILFLSKFLFASLKKSPSPPPPRTNAHAKFPLISQN